MFQIILTVDSWKAAMHIYLKQSWDDDDDYNFDDNNDDDDDADADDDDD